VGRTYNEALFDDDDGVSGDTCSEGIPYVSFKRSASVILEWPRVLAGDTAFVFVRPVPIEYSLWRLEDFNRGVGGAIP
jgi:hypothetical protein